LPKGLLHGVQTRRGYPPYPVWYCGPPKRRGLKKIVPEPARGNKKRERGRKMQFNLRVSGILPDKETGRVLGSRGEGTRKAHARKKGRKQINHNGGNLKETAHKVLRESGTRLWVTW